MNEFDETEEYESTPEEFGGPSHRVMIMKKILRVTGWIIFAAVLALLMWRMCATANDPKEVSVLTVNDKLLDCYKICGEDMGMYYQNLDEFNREEETYGYFSVTQSVIIPAADQIQIVFRHNISTLRYLAEDYPELLPDVPDRNEDLFDVTLVKVIDLTPDVTDDNKDPEALKFERYHHSDPVKAQTNRHNYVRMTFDGIDCSDALEVYVSIYYKGDLDYEQRSYGDIRIYTSDKDEIKCKYILTTADKKAISEAVNKEKGLSR